MTTAGLPAACEVAVIGGGIVAMSTALALARKGVGVTVFEKAQIGHEQSSRNWGWIRTLDRDLAELPLALESIAHWKRIQAQVDVGFRQTGVLYLARHGQDIAQYERWRTKAAALGSDAVLLDAEATAQRLPGSSRGWHGGLFGPSDGVAEPALATRGFARLATAAGARIVERCAVRGIETTAGRASSLVTEHGRVKADAVLLAGGAWTRLFCGNLGIEFPQLQVLGSVLRTSPLDAGLDSAINTRDFTCRKRADGGYTVSRFGATIVDIVPDSFRLLRQFLPVWLKAGVPVKFRFGRPFFRELRTPRKFDAGSVSPFETRRDDEPSPHQALLTDAFRKLVETFPVFGKARIAGTWAGHIDVTPDGLPVISPVASIPGFYLAAGFCGHGFGIGPAVGELAARMIRGESRGDELSAFRLSRFG